ncbi:UDP-N-acetylmuramate dehydrogenase [Glaciecola sp. MH2013]|uniref:UDP-N-acetylmuramate dehydrogenase n=1 Tax=Glaciecola sp. MH2013 TaxID=2785524 RepID=UPI0018A02DDE|nr:UDP-N-acetylmuramate dehydrogenase [Glaciecola sp. MH2013]MBF7075097.1 UDP-N-acetylmuramate dehydrogenase [Glaciecola sp. MH2013]
MHSLQHLHTFGFNVSANEIVVIKSIADFISTFKKHKNNNLVILGEGSNTVFIDNYEGIVFKNELMGIDITESSLSYHCRVQSGENWHNLVTYLFERGIFGLENLALIPGTVGAAPIQNIGAYGLEIEAFIKSVEYIDLESLETITLMHNDCKFGYRDSIFKHELAGKSFITCVNLVLPKDALVNASYSPLNQLSQATPASIYKKVIETRESKLPNPKQLGNAGSFFKNPVVSVSQLKALQDTYPSLPSFPAGEGLAKIPAAWLIDSLGFKGCKKNGVECYSKQPLVLVNSGDGTGSALLALAREIRDKVQTQFGIELENEVRLMGADQLIRL